MQDAKVHEPGYRIKNWSEHQHYKDRDPPWIKLHFKLLTSRDWVALDDASRVLAVASMLLASRNNGYIPDDPEYIQRVAYLHQPPDFKPLVKCGFLAPVGTPLASPQEKNTETENRDRDIDASKTLAPASKCPKKPYGEFGNVMLTDAEHSKLVAVHGAEKTAAGIDVLGAWLERTGKRRKSHYACMDKTSFVWEKASATITGPKIDTEAEAIEGARRMMCTVEQWRQMRAEGKL
jgi:hypothetical protein